MDHIQNKQREIRENIFKSYNTPDLEKSEENTLEKANNATIGEIREWGGKKYKKQANGKWMQVSDHGMTKQQHENKVAEHKATTLNDEVDYNDRKISERKWKNNEKALQHFDGDHAKEYDDNHFKEEKTKPLPKNIESFLSKFPDKANSWKVATDEIRDMARTAKELYNEHELDVYHDDEEKGLKPLNFRELKTPSEWNTQGKKYIREVYSKMSDKTKKKFEESFSHWFK